jgi:hypothetical protein
MGISWDLVGFDVFSWDLMDFTGFEWKLMRIFHGI